MKTMVISVMMIIMGSILAARGFRGLEEERQETQEQSNELHRESCIQGCDPAVQALKQCTWKLQNSLHQIFDVQQKLDVCETAKVLHVHDNKKRRNEGIQPVD